MENIHIVEMTENYLDQAAAIYNYYVENTTVTFHMERIDANDMREMLFQGDPLYVSFAILDGETLCGYAYMAPYKKREAYRISSEVTIYLKPEYAGKGIGSKVLAYLDKHAVQNGIHSFLAVICAENDTSVKLFGKNGYEKCAHLKEVGMKFGRMLDVVILQKLLTDVK